MLLAEQYPLEIALIESIIGQEATDKRWNFHVYFKIPNRPPEMAVGICPDDHWRCGPFDNPSQYFTGTFEELITYLTNRFGDRK